MNKLLLVESDKVEIIQLVIILIYNYVIRYQHLQ